jgi:predicted RNA methylase
MGYYPTPERTLGYIYSFLDVTNRNKSVNILDPCCGEGDALKYIADLDDNITTWGVELDAERANASIDNLNNVVCASIFDVRVNPLGSMGLLWLNPPYDSEDGKRVEMEFLKHAVKWLRWNGILVFIVPEVVLERDNNRKWIGEYFRDIKVFNAHRDDYPTYKQVVLFGIKRPDRVEDGEIISPPPYPFIEDYSLKERYIIPNTSGPTVFQGEECVTDDEIQKNRPKLLEEVLKITGVSKNHNLLYKSPLLPLRKAHLVTMLTAGILDGKIDDSNRESIVIKGFSNRSKNVRHEEDKEITTDTYSVGIRVMDKSRWFDIT